MARSRSAIDLDIRLMGPPIVLAHGVPLAVDTRKAIAILALLAAEGRPFARDELAALLWPESDDMAARGALRRTLSTLRTAAGDGSLHIDRARVELDRRRVRIDLGEIEAAARSDDRGTLAAAASMVRGSFLAGFNLRDSPEFDDWRAARAVAAERSVLTVLDRLATIAKAEGDLPAAIDAASRRLDLDPLDEAGHVRLMDLLDLVGDRSAALRQYRACVAILDRELGVEPLSTTTARYEAIREGTSAGDAAPPHAVAVPEAAPEGRAAATGPSRHALPVVGRDAQFATVASAYRSIGDAGGRLVLLIGEAGIGKTRLGDELTAQFRERGATVLPATAYPAERAIAYGPIVDLLRAASDLPDAASRVAKLDRDTRRELARLLPTIDPDDDIPRADGPGSHARLVAAIAAGLAGLVAGPAPGIVWIDDAQYLDAASREALGFLTRRLSAHPILLILAWRSEDLDSDGNRFAEQLQASSFAHTVTLGRFDTAEVSALVASAQGGGPDPSFVERLVAASEGLPLYVVEALAGEYPGAPESLPAGVRSVLRDRLTTIDETTMQVLATGAVIGRSFDLGTVRFASGRSEDEVVDALDGSVRRGLVRETGTGFDFTHGAIRDLVHDATSLARRRLLHRRIAEALRLDLAGSGREDLARLVLIATHERAAGRDAAAAESYRQAGERAASVFANREAIDSFGAALALGHPNPGDLHAEIGRLRTRLGDYDGAIAALEAAAAASPPEDLPTVEEALGLAHLRRGDLSAAAHHLGAAADGAREDRLVARVWVDRSIVCRRSGDSAGAIDAARQALAVAVRADDRAAAGAAHRMLGLASMDAGDPTQAVADLRLALEASPDDPEPTARIAALAALAMALAATGAVDDAVAHGQEAVIACRRIGDRHLEAAVENHLADILHAAGRDDDAMPHLRRAVEAFAEVDGDPADPDPGIWMLSAS